LNFKVNDGNKFTLSRCYLAATPFYENSNQP
jgi:hypothetical protein